jgi:hypothetical protein
MSHEDTQAYSSPAKKKRETFPIPKQRVTSLESTSTKSILAAHTYEHGRAQSDRESTKALLPLRKAWRLFPFSRWQLLRD